jgi:hypothetical protein
MTTDTDDTRIRDTYRDLAKERSRADLDRKILAMAAGEARTRYGLTRAWIRPVAWAATIGLSLAFILEISQLNDGAVPAETPAAAPAPVKTRIKEEVRPESVQSDAAADDTFAAKDQARPRSGGARALKATVAEPAAATLQETSSLEKIERPEPHCDDAARRSAESWYECILRLREEGLEAEAASELEVLRDTFPAFRESAER